MELGGTSDPNRTLRFGKNTDVSSGGSDITCLIIDQGMRWSGESVVRLTRVVDQCPNINLLEVFVPDVLPPPLVCIFSRIPGLRHLKVSGSKLECLFPFIAPATGSLVSLKLVCLATRRTWIGATLRSISAPNLKALTVVGYELDTMHWYDFRAFPHLKYILHMWKQSSSDQESLLVFNVKYAAMEYCRLYSPTLFRYFGAYFGPSPGPPEHAMSMVEQYRATYVALLSNPGKFRRLVAKAKAVDVLHEKCDSASFRSLLRSMVNLERIVLEVQVTGVEFPGCTFHATSLSLNLGQSYTRSFIDWAMRFPRLEKLLLHHPVPVPEKLDFPTLRHVQSSAMQLYAFWRMLKIGAPRLVNLEVVEADYEPVRCLNPDIQVVCHACPVAPRPEANQVEMFYHSDKMLMAG